MTRPMLLLGLVFQLAALVCYLVAFFGRPR
jgi:hypothetical protein